MSTLRIRTDIDPDHLTLKLQGTASAVNADVIDRAVREVIIKSPRRVLVDVGGLEFISSTALAHLAHLQRGVEATGGSLLLIGATERVGGVIRRCRVGDLLPMAEDSSHKG